MPLLGQSRCVWLTDGGCRHAGIDGLEIIDPDEDPENYAQRAAEQCAAASRSPVLPNLPSQPLLRAPACQPLPPLGLGRSAPAPSAPRAASAAAFER